MMIIAAKKFHYLCNKASEYHTCEIVACILQVVYFGNTSDRMLTKKPVIEMMVRNLRVLKREM